jgi:hypothetical protein
VHYVLSNTICNYIACMYFTVTSQKQLTPCSCHFEIITNSMSESESLWNGLSVSQSVLALSPSETHDKILAVVKTVAVLWVCHVTGYSPCVSWRYIHTHIHTYTHTYEGVYKSFRTESLTKYKIAIQLHLVAESCTICSSRSRRPVRKLLDTP